MMFLVLLGVAIYRYRDGLQTAFSQAVHAGWILLMAFPLFCVWNIAAAAGWRQVLKASGSQLNTSVWHLTIVRIKAQAINLVLPLAGVPGEIAKASLLAQKREHLVMSASSVVLDSMLSAFAGLFFSLMGVGHRLDRVVNGSISVVLILSLLLVVSGLFFASPQIAGIISHSRWIDKESPLDIGLRQLASASQGVKESFLKGAAWHLVERYLMACELWLATYGLGTALGLFDFLFIAAMMTSFSLVFFFIPAQAGAVEGGLMLGFSALKMKPETGLSVAMLRRLRQVVTGSFGLIAFEVSERNLRKNQTREHKQTEFPSRTRERRC